MMLLGWLTRGVGGAPPADPPVINGVAWVRPVMAFSTIVSAKQVRPVRTGSRHKEGN